MVPRLDEISKDEAGLAMTGPAAAEGFYALYKSVCKQLELILTKRTSRRTSGLGRLLPVAPLLDHFSTATYYAAPTGRDRLEPVVRTDEY